MKKYKISQIKLSVMSDENQLNKKICQILCIKIENLKNIEIIKKSIDARKKEDISYVYTVVASADKVSDKVLKNKNITIYNPIRYKDKIDSSFQLGNCDRPVIVGYGPAGIFCAYLLAKNGLNPIVFERGADIDNRAQIVDEFWKTGLLNTQTNVQFGEGGAGTFSDGKLNTGIKDKYGRERYVLKTLVEYGADEKILYESRPHVGTDILHKVIKNIRNQTIEYGADIRFNSQLEDIEIRDGMVSGIIVNGQYIKCSKLVLAIGHSARDTFEMLYNKQINMEQKPFAIGVRMEHRRADIDNAMYGENHPDFLPASPYKLTAKSSSGRGVYSFCMCPGGYVVNASSEKGHLAINGMSYSARDSQNSNSAIVTTITPDDFKSDHVLAGMYLQRELEKKAYEACSGRVPVQKYGDFKKNKLTSSLGKVTPMIKGTYSFGNIRDILPDYISKSIIECMSIFAKSIQGYDQDDILIEAVESRTSSPIRITRNDDFVSVSVEGLYPCGEGAGYAGGITSAAIDGIKVFEALIKALK